MKEDPLTSRELVLLSNLIERREAAAAVETVAVRPEAADVPVERLTLPWAPIGRVT